MSLKYALAGNPNCGKTTLFNALTGSNQYVGNWPGVTVEKKEGRVTQSSRDIRIVDLPGIYSLSPYSMEEIVTRNYIIEEKPDLIVNIVDATNLERNLYLSLQLAELAVPMVIALNMMDVVEKQGDSLDASLLARLLGIRVVPISASKGTGVHKLLHAAEHELAHRRESGHVDRHTGQEDPPDIYQGNLKKTIYLIEAAITGACKKAGMPLRWSAVKLVEGDNPTKDKLNLPDDVYRFIEDAVGELETGSLDREMVVADQKYKAICEFRNKVLKKAAREGALTASDKIDAIVTGKYFALPLFAGVMGFVFYLTFGSMGAKLVDYVDWLINIQLLEAARSFLTGIGAANWAVGLVCDGMIAGIGAVLAFFPQIALLFFFLSFLEDSGYMARAAFIMDRALHGIGLSGKSFVPMLMGFGCSVPAIMATRTLANDRDRRLTIMLVPFMSCSAKMPVYMLFVGVFFPGRAWLAVGSLYFLGLAVAVLYALLLRKTVLRGGHSPFVMELPPYRLPTAKTLGLHLWEKIKDFLSKAGTVLLGASVLVWFCRYFDFSLARAGSGENSILGVVGAKIAPLFAPLGFGDWKSSVSLLSGLVARESIVSTMAILYNTGEQSMAAILRSALTPAAAYSMMTFALLFIPCAAAVGAIRREMRSVKWTFFALGLQAASAWAVTFAVYQVAKLIL